MDWKTWLAPSVTVGVALLGFAVKYLNDIKIAQRKDRLDRINQQLKFLYGPLYAIDHKAVLRRWDNDDYSEHVSLVDYPVEQVRSYAEKTFTDPKNEQAGLLGGKRKHHS